MSSANIEDLTSLTDLEYLFFNIKNKQGVEMKSWFDFIVDSALLTNSQKNKKDIQFALDTASEEQKNKLFDLIKKYSKDCYKNDENVQKYLNHFKVLVDDTDQLNQILTKEGEGFIRTIATNQVRVQEYLTKYHEEYKKTGVVNFKQSNEALAENEVIKRL